MGLCRHLRCRVLMHMEVPKQCGEIHKYTFCVSLPSRVMLLISPSHCAPVVYVSVWRGARCGVLCVLWSGVAWRGVVTLSDCHRIVRRFGPSRVYQCVVWQCGKIRKYTRCVHLPSCVVLSISLFDPSQSFRLVSTRASH